MELTGRPLLGTAEDFPLFVDREDELRIVERSIEMRTNVLVLGGRGMGRTSFLRQLASAVTKPERRILFIEGALATSPLELLALLRYRVAPNVRASGLVEQAATAAAAVRLAASGGFVRRPVEGVPGESEMLLELVRDIGKQLSRRDREHVALVDEIPSVDIAHTLFGRLRDELWQLPLVWIVAGNASDRAVYTRPPADAFFPRIVSLDPLSDSAAMELIRRRVPRRILSDTAARAIIAESQGSPRRLIQLANDAVLAGGDVSSITGALSARERLVDSLGEPAQRVVDELDAHGPSSASDPQLLKRLGWSRSRAAQVLRELEEAGVVVGTVDRSGTGRPRKVYALAKT